MASDTKPKRLISEASYLKMKVRAGLLTEAQAEKIQEEAQMGSDDINDDVVTENESFENKDKKKAKEDPSTKDAKGTDKIAKSVKGGPSADLKKVPEPKFNLKENAFQEQPPMGGAPQQDQSLGGPELGGEEKVTVDADTFAQDLAAGLSMALKKHFPNSLSVTSDGADPAGELGSEGGEGFEPIPDEELGSDTPQGGAPAGIPQSNGGQPEGSEVPDEDDMMREGKTSKLVSTMVESIMKKILSK